jgi:hypothetical protein
VELTASLTSDEGYGNGNKMLLKRVLKGEVQIGSDVDEAVRLRPEVSRRHSGAGSCRRSSNFHGVTSTMYTCRNVALSVHSQSCRCGRQTKVPPRLLPA